MKISYPFPVTVGYVVFVPELKKKKTVVTQSRCLAENARRN